MKATASVITCCAIIGLTFACAESSAHPLAIVTLQGTVAMGQVPPADPFGQRNVGPAPAAATPLANNANPSQPAGDARTANAAYLKEARLALAYGDLRKAAQLTAQARQLGLKYPPTEDSPERVEALIQKLNQLSADARANISGPETKHNQAQFLLDQAEGLIQYGELNNAAKLVEVAKKIQVQYRPLERTPDQVLNKIAVLRNEKPVTAATPLPQPPAAVSPAGPAAPTRLPRANQVADPRKTEALRLIGLAEAALAKGDPLQAQKFATQATQLGLPDSAFQDGQTPPWVVQMKVTEAIRSAGGRVVQASGANVQQAGQTGSPAGPQAPVAQSLYQPESDTTQNVMAQAIQAGEAPPQPLSAAGSPQTPGVPGNQPIVPNNQPVAPNNQPVAPNNQPIATPNQPTPAATPEPTANPTPIPTVTPDPSVPVPVQPTGPQTAVSPGVQLFQDGLRALERRERDAALAAFKEAWKFENELDVVTRQRLQDKLSLLQASRARPLPTGPEPSPLDQEMDRKQQLLRQKLYSEIVNEEKAAQELSQTDPKAALVRLKQLRERVTQSEVAEGSKKQLLTLVDRSINNLEAFVKRNISAIELDERNREIMKEIKNEQLQTYEVQGKIAELVEKFNNLVDEERFAEAEVIAKTAREIDPENPVVVNLQEKARFIRRVAQGRTIREQNESGFFHQMQAVDESAIPFDDRVPFVFGEKREWSELSRSRLRQMEQFRTRFSPEEMVIQKALKQQVHVQFVGTPLGEVVDTLGEMAGINVHLDPEGLDAENINSDQPITLNLAQPISMQSALNLILEHLGLSYVIQDEVLLITSEQTRESKVYNQVYNVADLVIPIPNFVPSNNIGLPGAINSAFQTLGYNGGASGGYSSPLALAQSDSGTTDGSVLAQMSASGMLNGGTRPTRADHFGPGGFGGGAQADFDSLIELITSTIAPQSWDEVGGAGAIQGFDTNLSLVVSQTQEVHEQIADLLDQLRRLQDLQVTIEVRFITLTDDFFERIGIDFDVDIDDNTGLRDVQLAADIYDDNNPSTIVGLDPTGQLTPDLDIQFVQDSFGASVPPFGGFDAGTAANIGFAILSDIEVFFLLQAAHGDTRSNVMQAPKVTLFNGQSATVSDTQQRPFVISVIPVVGDFAAAQQPVIAVLAEGTTLSVQAVASADRRFVRLTLVPFFSRIGAVDTFTFTGSVSSDTSSTSATAENNQQQEQNSVIDAVTSLLTDSSSSTNTTTNTNNNVNNRVGTTVQLPQFGFTTVTTTVSVPDGGTVLLGGIKRLSEGRTERGIPLLEKVPYVNRLFKNVGIGRASTSLMLMVTPRIIIQEEEELLQTGFNSAEN